MDCDGKLQVELKVNIEVKVDGSTLHQAKVKLGRKRAQTKFRKQPFIGSCHVAKRTYTTQISGKTKPHVKKGQNLEENKGVTLNII